MMRVSSRWWDLPCFAFILCQIWSGQVAAQNSFLQPWTSGPPKDYSKNIAYNTGENVIMEWEVSVTNAILVLYQDNHPGDAQGGPSKILINNLDGTILNWEVTYGGLNTSYNNVYYLAIGNAGNNSITAHYFNISGAPLSTSSSVTSTPTSSISSITTVTTTSPPATVTVISKGSSLSSGDIAGVVVGCIVGVALVLGILCWFWEAGKQRFQTDGANSAVTQQAIKQGHELAGSGMEHELPGTGRLAGRRGSQVHEALGSTTFLN